MSTLKLGPGLAGFPAFPELNIEDLAPDELEALLVSLEFAFTDTSFRFALDSGAFGLPGLFRYEFAFVGDFSSIASGGLGLAELFNPANAGATVVTIAGSETVNALSGELAIALVADSGPSAPLAFAQFFGTLLDPRNFTTDILVALGFDLADFTEIDLSGFSRPVVLGTPNGATVGVDGTISLPSPDLLPIPFFAPAPVGVVSFEDEITELAVTSVIGGAGGDVLGAAGLGLTVRAGMGDDVVAGSSEADDLAGEEGDDRLFGSGGADRLDGGAGDDLLVGTGRLTGGADADTFVVASAPGSATEITDLSSAEGDALDLSALGVAGPFGLASALSFDGSDWSVTAGGQTVVLTGASLQTVLGAVANAAGRGPEGVSLGTSGSDVRVAGGTLAGLDGDDTLIGLLQADTLLGLEGDDTLAGGAGDDVALGGAGNDDLSGGLGADILDGGLGDDTLSGGLGFDVLSGGDGADVFEITPALLTYDRITDFKLGEDRIDLRPLLGTAEIDAETFDAFVWLDPLGPTELTGFLYVDSDGDGAGRARIVAQLDGAPFGFGPGGVTEGLLGFDDVIL